MGRRVVYKIFSMTRVKHFHGFITFGPPRVCKQQRRISLSDQCLCYSLILESFITELATDEFSIFYLVFVAVRTGLSLTLLETPKTGFVTRPIYGIGPNKCPCYYKHTPSSF